MISSATAGAQIRYTVDEGAHWTTIANGGSTDPFAPGVRGKTLTAVAFKSGMIDSNPHSEEYYREDGRAMPGAPETVASTVTYDLDKSGNRTRVVDDGTPTSYTPNNINQYSQVGTYVLTNGREHEVSQFQGLAYSYINDERLSSVNAGHGVSYQLAYDALGRCVKRTSNGAQTSVTTYFMYDGEKPIGEFDGNGAVVAINIYGKGVDEILERGAYGTDNQWHWYCLQQDHEGSITHLTDTSGVMVEAYLYDAFGAPTILKPPPPAWTQLTASAYNNRFMFTGREWSPYGFYEYRARAYHPSLGRFMSEDPKGFDAGDYNLFRYCHNDPLDLTDPMGLADDTVATYSPRQTSQWKADEEYGQAMAQAQWAMRWSTQGAIGVGVAGYQQWSLSRAMGGLTMGQIGLQGDARTRLEITGGVKDSDPGDFQLLGQLNGPQLLKLKGEPVWDPYTQRMVLAPPGFNLSENIAAARRMWGSTWVNKILISPKQGGWDYKQIGPFRDLGNINFGATGRANGWPGSALFKGGELFKAYRGTSSPSENARDQFMIGIGINYYDTGGR